MATWSSFEKDKLIIEGFRDFFKKKGEPAGTYPASELTTIVNLISNLAKKLNIKVDTSAIVDEFEAVLKSENYNLQEQEDKIMIGGDVPLNLNDTPKLKAFMDAVAQANKRGLGILLKALNRGAFDVSGYEPAASTGQTPTEEPKQRASAFPIQITVDEFSKFINESQFRTIETMFKKLGVSKNAEQIKKEFIAELPSLFRIFDSELSESDVGDYFRLQTTTNETIDITKKIKTNNPRINLQTFLFGALLKNYIKKRSNEVSDIVADLPKEVLTQLQNSVSGLTNKTLKSILVPKRDADEPAIKPSSTDSPVAGEEEAEVEKNFDTETGLPISEKGRNSIIKQIGNVTEKDEFSNLYVKLANSKFSNRNRKDSFHKARKNRDYNYLSGFDAGPEAQNTIRQKFKDLFLTDEEETETDRAQSAPEPAPAVSEPQATEEPAEKTPAQTAVDLLNGIDAQEQGEITVELFNDFVRDLKSFIGEINKKKRRRVDEIRRVDLAKNLGLKAKKLDSFFNNNDKYKSIRARLAFMTDKNALSSFFEAFEQVANSLPADTPAEPEAEEPSPKPKVNREPAPEAAPEPEPEPETKRQTNDNDPNKYKRAKFRIKNEFNNLGISGRASRKFDIWKDKVENIDGVDSIKKSTLSTGENEEQKIYLITLDNEEQYALPYQGDVFNLKFAFDEEGEIPPVDAYLKDVNKLAKIKNNKVEQKGKFTYLTEILNESLMLRWKTIAGIK